MTKVIMHGCNGKMGQTITEMCKDDPEIEIVAGIDPVSYTHLIPVFVKILITVCLAAIVICNGVSILDRLVYGIRPIGAQLVHTVGFFTTCFITDWIICTVTGIGRI